MTISYTVSEILRPKKKKKKKDSKEERAYLFEDGT